MDEKYVNSQARRERDSRENETVQLIVVTSDGPREFRGRLGPGVFIVAHKERDPIMTPDNLIKSASPR